MTSLLDSRVLHHRVRTLSRKARESEVHEQEPPNRCLPARHDPLAPMNNSCGELSNRQRSQQLRWKKERDVRLNESLQQSANVSLSLPDLTVRDNPVERSTTTQRRQRGQQDRRRRERTQANPLRSIHGNRSRLVGTFLITMLLLC